MVSRLAVCRAYVVPIVVSMALFGADLFAIGAEGRASRRGKASERRRSAAMQRVAWDLGGKLSLAAMTNAAGKPRKQVEKLFAEAVALAKKLGTEAPPLPESTKGGASDSAAALRYVLKTAGEPIGAHLAKEHGGGHAKLFELSTKSSLLLLVYSPGGRVSGSIADQVERLAGVLKIPSKSWKPLVDKIEAEAPYDDVKAALLKMHSEIARQISPSK